MRRISILLLILIILNLFLIGCSSDKGSKKIVIGGKADTEAYVLANLAKLLLEDNGFEIDTQLGVKSILARKALETKEVDLYYDYTGTAYTVYFKQSNKEIMTDSEKVYDWVKRRDAKEGLIWLDKINYNNTYTIMMREDQAERLKIASISDLAAKTGEIALSFGTDSEFYNRPDGLQALANTYGIDFDQVVKMSAGIIYKALKEDKIDSGMGYSTDGRIDAFNFINLEDNKGFFPVYNPAPIVREEVLNKHPEIEGILKVLTTKLTTRQIQKLNSQVDIEHEDPSKVAAEWLKEQGLIE
ncbi:ABC transporter substrate-binding protein [Orenia marismortui]|uniref:ABC transporter substrate-binding protein n=1 Tax=Orenia marismortui TaxID=46469 RepID=UPI000376DCF8|nr:glycine betaine ABC transporter substrate-binding protein [Orenia marismortui]